MGDLIGPLQRLRDEAVAEKVRKDDGERIAVIPDENGSAQDEMPIKHAVSDWVTARHAVSSVGEPQAEDEDDLADPLTIHDIISAVRVNSRTKLVTRDMTALSLIQTWWLYRREWESADVPFTYRQAAKALGVQYSGQWARGFRASLRRLDAWKGEISVKNDDGSEDWQTLGLLSSVRGHEGHKREDGHITVRLHEFMHALMKRKEYSLYPLAPYLQLRSDVDRELYRLIETQRGFGVNGDYEITITPELLATIGLNDRHERRVRSRLRKACEALMAADPRYLRAGVRKNKAGAYVLFFHRQKVVAQQPLVPGVSVAEDRANTG
jgi:hypothetical protein